MVLQLGVYTGYCSPGSANIQLSGNSPVLKSKVEVFPGAPFNARVVPTFAFSAKLFK